MNPVEIIFHYLVFPGFIFAAIMGLLLNWIDRKLAARIQWRVGPSFLQPVWDILKLFFKETHIPESASVISFLASPLFAMTTVTIFVTTIGLANIYPSQSFLGDLIVVMHLLFLFPLCLAIGGSVSSNPLSQIGSVRKITLCFAYWLPLLFAMFTLILKAKGNIKLGDFVLYQWRHGSFLYSWSGALSFITAFFSFHAQLGFVPFDTGDESSTDPYFEYSGPPLGIWKLTESMFLYGVTIFLVTLYWSGIKYFWDILKPLILIIGMSILKQILPRLRIDQVFRFFWIPIFLISILALILAANGY